MKLWKRIELSRNHIIFIKLFKIMLIVLAKINAILIFFFLIIEEPETITILLFLFYWLVCMDESIFD